VNALIAELEADIEFSDVLEKAQCILHEKTPFKCALKFLQVDCETAVRVLLDCEILACIHALWDCPSESQFSGLIKHFVLHVEMKQEGAPSTGTIADYRLQRRTELGGEHHCAVPIEAKGPHASPPLLASTVSNGKHAHQLRCEIDAVRQTGDGQAATLKLPAHRRQFGVLCDQHFMFLFYTKRREGKMHAKAIGENNERGRLSTLILAILISLEFKTDFFKLDDDLADDGSNAGEGDGASDANSGADDAHSSGGASKSEADETTPPKDAGDVPPDAIRMRLWDAQMPAEEVTRAHRTLQFALNRDAEA